MCGIGYEGYEREEAAYDRKCADDAKWEEEAEDAAWVLHKKFPRYGFNKAGLVCDKEVCKKCGKCWKDEDFWEDGLYRKCENVIVPDVEDDDDGWDEIIRWNKGVI